MPMPSHVRLIHLLEQRRFADAEAHLRRRLEHDPGDAPTHALRALCLLDLGRAAEAAASAEQAVELAPDVAFGHWALGTVLGGEGRFLEAGAAAREALRLEPGDPSHHALLAQCLAGQRRWDEAIAAADDGLALDGGNDACLRIRALALQQHGRAAEAERMFAQQVARDPWDALSHAGRGWASLQRGAPEAAEHFRASLRLDPASGYARAGLAEAVRGRSVALRTLRRWEPWLRARFGRVRLAAVLGALGVYLLARDGAVHPAVAALGLAPGAVCAFLVLLTWTADPLADWRLSRDPVGRTLLPPARAAAARAVVLVLALGLGSAAGAAAGSEWALRGALATLPLVIPVAATVRVPAGGPRRALAGYTLFLLVLAAVAVWVPGTAGLWLACAAALGGVLGSRVAAAVAHRAGG
jgi:tetratricopeptide (TPR) repeat protein